MTREERLNNTEHKSKSEATHIEHTMLRLKERHDLEIDIGQYYDLLALVQKESESLYDLNSSNSVKRVNFLGHEIWLIYGRGSYYKARHFKIPARIKTILKKDFDAFPMPDRFGMDISGETLAKDVRAMIEEIKKFASTIVPTITKKELFTLPEYEHLGLTFKSVSEKLHYGKLTENDLYRGAFKIILTKYDNRSLQGNN